MVITGTARTSLVITIGPSPRHRGETASTIMFGQRVCFRVFLHNEDLLLYFCTIFNSGVQWSISVFLKHFLCIMPFVFFNITFLNSTVLLLT